LASAATIAELAAYGERPERVVTNAPIRHVTDWDLDTMDQQGITPAEVRWALYGPPSHAPMRIASEKLFASLLLAECSIIVTYPR